jgi:PAS domain S-box-containing protein
MANPVTAVPVRATTERDLAEFFEHASVGIHWVGPDGTILRANKAELMLLGYAEHEYVGRHIAEFHVDADVIHDILRRLAAGEILRDVEARMRCKDGSIKHVLIDSSVRFDGTRFVHTHCFTRDISDRKRAEEAHARLAAIVESSQDAIISKTLDGIIMSWNAGAQQIFGYEPHEAIGQPILLIVPPERHDEERVILARISRGERVEHYETVRVTKDGRRIDVSLTISPVRDNRGTVIGASKISRDISSRKRAEQRLAMQNAVTSALARSETLEQAAPRILEAICTQLGWHVAGLWHADGAEHVLRNVAVYDSPETNVPRFIADTRERTFAPGVGLPGRVWATGRALCIPDVTKDDNFPRAPVADVEGLHGAVAFPVALEGEVLGVIEFFSRRVQQPDNELLELMTAIGSQIGQFIERRRAEAALRDSEQRFRVMASSIPSMIWTAAPDGTITYANPRWFEYCGLTPEENAHGWPEMVLHPEDRARCIAAWQAALENGVPYEIEVRNRRHDGAYRWFVTRAIPSRDAEGKVVRWFGTTTDIHEQKQAEHTTRFLADASAALASMVEPERTLRLVADFAVPHFADWCAVDILDADGSVRRLALTHSTPLNVQLLRDLDERFPARSEEPWGMRKVLNTGETDWVANITDDMLRRRAQNEEHVALLRSLGLTSFISVPLKSRSRVLGAITFVAAESRRSYSADDMRAAEDLAHRAVIAIENTNLVATLREADRRKDEFLAMLAHELRNPLAPIRNAVEIFRAKGLETSELRWGADVIDRQVHQMTRLVDDLLDVSRITRGKIALRTERVDLGTVIQTAIEGSRPVLNKWGHQLSVSFPAEPVYLDGDATRLSQIIANLLNNAAKYTDIGGRISLKVETTAEHAVVSVKDNGIGIPPDALPQIFDLFAQVNQALERSEGGLGIGLTLVRRLVELHGGTVEALSDGPGKGSEFVVRLPLPAPVANANSTVEDASDREVPPRRILIVDDNHDACDSLAMLLRMFGHEVETAHDGIAAVHAAQEFHPEVILLDIGLPKLNGFDAARRIRAQRGGSRMVLVALTGWGQEEDRRNSREAGFDHHMTKPVEFRELQRLLRDGKRADTAAR